jgi:choline-sulfatase
VKTRPNLILILTDHFRRDALGPNTPNLSALARSGVNFTNAYCAAPLCQPARVALVTGTYPSQNGVCGNQNDPVAPQLRDDAFMHQLRAAGYRTAMIGKHHYIDRYGLGMDVRDDAAEVARYGFDHVLQVVDDGENGHNQDEYTAFLRERGLLDEFRTALADRGRGFRHPFGAELTADGFIGAGGVRFVEEHSGDVPFYLNLSFIGPHPPLWHPGELHNDPKEMAPPIGAPDEEHVRERRAHYADKCALIDRCVGRLVAALEKRGLLEDTVMVFTSDHGDMLGDFGIWDKRHFYESSAGVPLFICGPGVPREERRNGPRLCRSLVSHLDLYATVLGLAGIEHAPDRRRDGRDLVALARGDAGPGRAAARGDAGPGRAAVFAELGTSAMIRTPKWKLVFDPEQGGVVQLFNMHVDPQELQNLAGVAGYETVSAELVERLLAERIRRTQFAHQKERQRLQRVRAGF